MRVELVTTLKRQATKILAELHTSKAPVLITEHGQPSAYLVEDYEFMQQRMAILEGIARGEQAIKKGNTFSNQEAKEKMSKWLFSLFNILACYLSVSLLIKLAYYYLRYNYNVIITMYKFE